MIHREEAKYARYEIQATIVMVKTKRQAVMFAAAYCPPRYNLKKTDSLNLISKRKIYGWRGLQRKEYILGAYG
jgi:hypothetical protein